MLVIFISDAQRPVFIHGYGHILCIRENFKKVHDNIRFDKKLELRFEHFENHFYRQSMADFRIY